MNSTKDNPFAQDSLPIGTVVEWEGKKIEVVSWNIGGCIDCIFYSASCKDKWCTESTNSDKTVRKYILINEQQEEETMSIKLEDGKKYVTEAGDVVTVNLVRDLASGYPYEGSNSFSYTINGKLYFDGDNSPKDIVREYAEEVKQEPEGHIHAELMVEYAKEALVSKEPWKNWEWFNENSQLWRPVYENNSLFSASIKYRRKPKTILINGYEVPEPLRVAPEVGTYVYIVDLTHIENWIQVAFGANPYGHQRLLDKGLMHMGRDAVVLHAKALLSFTTTVQEKQDEEV